MLTYVEYLSGSIIIDIEIIYMHYKNQITSYLYIII